MDERQDAKAAKVEGKREDIRRFRRGEQIRRGSFFESASVCEICG
jgi:hypothetical protein